MEQPLIHVADLARSLQVNLPTFRNAQAICTPIPPTVQIGKRVYFELDAALAWVRRICPARLTAATELAILKASFIPREGASAA